MAVRQAGAPLLATPFADKTRLFVGRLIWEKGVDAMGTEHILVGHKSPSEVGIAQRPADWLDAGWIENEAVTRFKFS